MIYSQTYSGVAVYSTTFIASSPTDIADALANALTSAGWTISGSSGDWIAQSAASHPNGWRVTVRIRDDGGNGTCRIQYRAPISEESTANGAYLLQRNDTWRVIAGAYWFLVYSVDNGRTSERSMAYVCVPYVPPAIVGSPPTISYLAHMHTSGFNANGGHLGNGLINTLNFAAPRSIIGADIVFGNTHNRFGAIGWNGNTGAEWFNLVRHACDPLLHIEVGSQSRIYGLLWDIVLIGGPLTVETTIAYDSRTWRVIAGPFADIAATWCRCMLAG